MSIHGIDVLSGQTSSISSEEKRLAIANFVWDTDSLTWVRAIQGTSGGTSSNVNVLSTVGLTDTQLRASPVTTTADTKAQRVDDLGTTLYVGKAALGASAGGAVWQIKKITEVGTELATQWANGNSLYNNVWDDRTSLTYS
jgi:hypothetical protein